MIMFEKKERERHGNRGIGRERENADEKWDNTTEECAIRATLSMGKTN